MVPFAPEASRALVFAVVRAGCVGEGLSVGLFHFFVSFLVWMHCCSSFMFGLCLSRVSGFIFVAHYVFLRCMSFSCIKKSHGSGGVLAT